MYHIIFLSPHSDPQASLGEPDSGGQCIYEHELALALSSQPDFKVTTFCRQTFQRPDISDVNNSYRIVRIHCGREPVIPKEIIEGVLDEFVDNVEKYLQSQDQTQTFIVHGHYWDGAYAAMSLKSRWKAKLPFIWTPHSLGSLKRRNFLGAENEFSYNFIPRQTWESYAMHIADQVIVSSEEEKQVVINDYSVHAEKIYVLAPGVDIQHLQRIDQNLARKSQDLPTDGKILLALGRMVPTKGYHRSILAFASLLQKYKEPVYFVIIAGSAHPTSVEEKSYLEKLKTMIAEHHLEGKVLLRSAVPHEQVQEVFSAADIFLMSSEYEPFGLVTIEAMGMGLPVVAENSGGSVSIITHNRTGILTDFKDPERVASYLLPLLKDTELYDKISARGQRHIKRTYDWSQKSSDFAQQYRKISRYSPVEHFQEIIEQNHFLQQHFRACYKTSFRHERQQIRA